MNRPTARAVPVPSGVFIPDLLVVDLARVVLAGTSVIAERDGQVSQQLADLVHDLNVRAAEFRAWAQRRTAAAVGDARGSGSGGTALDPTPEPAARSVHELEEWLPTGMAAQRLGLSTGLLRRWARAGHAASRPGRGGYEWSAEWVRAQPARRPA